MNARRIPYPTLHTGLTLDDIPAGYSAFNTIFDDGLGYAPVIVGHEWDDSGRQVIIVAISPGRYVRAMMVTAGGGLAQATETLVPAVEAVKPPGVPTSGAPDTGSARAPELGPRHREV